MSEPMKSYVKNFGSPFQGDENFQRCYLVSDVEAYLAALPPAMTWTSDRPVKPGNYWWRENERYSEKIVSVTSRFAMKSYVYFPGQSSGKDLDDVEGEWAGPIEPPQ